MPPAAALAAPARPSGDVIPQDRSTTAIELEQVLDDLLPLLRTVQPAKLNATLSALATALEGRGERLGRQPRAGRRLLHPAQPGAARHQGGHLAALADVSRDLRRRGPRPGADAAQLRRDHAAPSRPSRTRYAASSPGPPGSPRPPGSCSSENDDRIIELAAVGRPTLELLARYSPEYPCLLAGPDPVQRLHRQDVRERRAAHHPRGRPGPDGLRPGRGAALGRAPRARTATGCRTRRVPCAGQPLPGRHPRLPAPRTASSPASWSTRRAVSPGTAEEQQVVDALVAPRDGRAGRRRARPRDPAVRADGARDGGGAVVKTTSRR